MNDNDNIVEFPTKERKSSVTKERTQKINDFSSSFTPSYNLNSMSVTMSGFDKWIPPLFNEDTISFANLNNSKWCPSFGPTDTNLLTSIVDRCAAIQKQCIIAGSNQETIALQHVLDKLDEALLLSKISSK
jgi:hypothetical protein